MKDPKQIVSAGYDECAARYNAARSRDVAPEVQRFLDVLKLDSSVLDIGCGGASPITERLAQVARVTGVDISRAQISAARERHPSATFIVGDVMCQDFAPSSFDAVVAFYAIFHLPREEHRLLLERIRTWLRPDGYLLVTLANSDDPGYTEEFFGTTMYWSNYEPDWYFGVLAKLGFEVLERAILRHGYRGELNLPPERHPIVLARRVATESEVGPERT